jgi:hypothetical protein
MTDSDVSEEPADSNDEYPDLNDIPVNEKDKKFLQAIFDLDGEARTRDIRERTGLNSGDTKYRFDKFSSNGIIEIEYEDKDNAKYVNPQKIGKLTDRGEQFIRQGFAGGEIFDEDRKKKVELTLEDYEDLVENVEEVENKLKLLRTRLDEMSGESQSINKDKLREMLTDMDFSPESEEISSFEIKTRMESLERVTANLMDRLDEFEDQFVPRSEIKEEVSEQVSLQFGENKHPAVKETKSTETAEDETEIPHKQELADLENRLTEVEEDINYFYEWVQKTETFLLALKLLYDDQGIDLSKYIKQAKEQTE